MIKVNGGESSTDNGTLTSACTSKVRVVPGEDAALPDMGVMSIVGNLHGRAGATTVAVTSTGEQVVNGARFAAAAAPPTPSSSAAGGTVLVLMPSPAGSAAATAHATPALLAQHSIKQKAIPQTVKIVQTVNSSTTRASASGARAAAVGSRSAGRDPGSARTSADKSGQSHRAVTCLQNGQGWRQRPGALYVEQRAWHGWQ